MRAYIVQRLTDDVELAARGLPANAVFSAENVDTPEPRPFIVIRWQPVTPTFRTAPSQSRPFEVYVYDKRGDYSRIDFLIARIKEVLTSIKAQQTGTGWITQVDWIGDGGDGYDDVYEALHRTAAFNAVASYTPAAMAP